MLTPAGRAVVAAAAAVSLIVVVALLFAFVPGVRGLFASPPSGPRAEATGTVDATAAREPTAAVVPTAPPSPTFAEPARLKVPKLKIDVKVVQVGIDKSGVMEAPDGPTIAGWYKFGTRPGEQGSAVIAGHSGYRNGRDAIFDHLDKLKPGDAFSVIDEAGVEIRFVVREARLFDPKADTTDVFGRYDGRYLNLVTCTGAWNAKAGTHAKRLVVFADAVQ